VSHLGLTVHCVSPRNVLDFIEDYCTIYDTFNSDHVALSISLPDSIGAMSREAIVEDDVLPYQKLMSAK